MGRGDVAAGSSVGVGGGVGVVEVERCGEVESWPLMRWYGGVVAAVCYFEYAMRGVVVEVVLWVVGVGHAHGIAREGGVCVVAPLRLEWAALNGNCGDVVDEVLPIGLVLRLHEGERLGPVAALSPIERAGADDVDVEAVVYQVGQSGGGAWCVVSEDGGELDDAQPECVGLVVAA